MREQEDIDIVLVQEQLTQAHLKWENLAALLASLYVQAHLCTSPLRHSVPANQSDSDQAA